MYKDSGGGRAARQLIRSSRRRRRLEEDGEEEEEAQPVGYRFLRLISRRALFIPSNIESTDS